MNWQKKRDLIYVLLEALMNLKRAHRQGCVLYDRFCNTDSGLEAYTFKARDFQVEAGYLVHDPDACGAYAAEASVHVFLEILLSALERGLIEIDLNDLNPIGIRNELCSWPYEDWFCASPDPDDVLKLQFPVAMTEKGYAFCGEMQRSATTSNGSLLGEVATQESMR